MASKQILQLLPALGDDTEIVGSCSFMCRLVQDLEGCFQSLSQLSPPGIGAPNALQIEACERQVLQRCRDITSSGCQQTERGKVLAGPCGFLAHPDVFQPRRHCWYSELNQTRPKASSLRNAHHAARRRVMAVRALQLLPVLFALRRRRPWVSVGARVSPLPSQDKHRPWPHHFGLHLRRASSITEADVELDSSASGVATSTEEETWATENGPRRHKHLCLYFTQGLCTLADDPEHVAKFTHLYPDLPVKPSDLEKLCPQPFDYFLVLDLEGRVEILEFPVVLLDARTLAVVDRFHRFVRPVKMSEQRITEYIEGKYGRWGLDRVWHDTAVPFTQVIENFEEWLKSHSLWNPTKRGKMRHAAFVTCGNWDVKTKIPEQCVSSEITVPPYFHEWVNLKDIYLNFYNQRAGGMLAMLKGLKMHIQGSHHLGLDDAHNIARVLQRVLSDGAVVKITAKRSATDPKDVKFTFRNRVK